MSAPYDVRAVEHLGRHRLRPTIADRTVRDLDVGPKLTGRVCPACEPLRDVEFAQTTVDPETHTVVWPNGADTAPDALHEWAVDPVSAA